ncbi:cortical protein KAR9-domain-containing protein [Lipomyces kononenkoae]|uniref:Cortical protein KAR9-domain-containing protein n=1 Tax=Lipomyces kononenkoae TaxID=34357 RepID=A0ACC3SUM9_LIPKO
MALSSPSFSRHSKSEFTALPFTASVSLLPSLLLPSMDESDEALVNFLHSIRTVRSRFEELQLHKDIRSVTADAEGLALVEQQFANMTDHLDFLRLRTNGGNHTSKNAKDILSVAGDIEHILRKSREHVDVALEWSELHDTVMADVESVMEESEVLLAELQRCQRTHDIIESDRLKAVLDLDGLMTSLMQSPVYGHGKLVNLRDADKMQNSKLFSLSKKMQPLRVSLDTLDQITRDIVPRLEQSFPDAHQYLITRREALEAKWKTLSLEADKIKREMGEDRWISMLKEACNQARKLMTEIDRIMNNLESTQANALDDYVSIRNKELYEHKAIELVPEILKVLELLSRAMQDKVTTNEDIKREQLQFNDFWHSLNDRIVVIDEKYDLDIRKKIGLTGGRESRSSMRSSLSSTSGAAVEFNFGRSRSRSRTSAHSNKDPLSPTNLSRSSSPSDEEPFLQTPTVTRKAKENDLCTPTLSRRAQKAPPSAIPVRKRPSITPELFAEPSSLPRPRTPCSGYPNTKRRASGIPQPKFTTAEVDIPPVPAIPQSASSTIKRHQISNELRYAVNSVVPVTPQKKQSQVLSTRESETAMTPTSQSAKSYPVAVPMSRTKIARPTTTLPKSSTPAHLSQRTPRVRTVSSRDPFGPLPTSKLNHHASTPNLSSLAKKASRGNLVVHDLNGSVPPVPAIPTETPLKAAGHGYKIPAGLSPSSQQKYYIKYGSPTSADAMESGTAPPALVTSTGNSIKKSSVRKSMGTVKEKPRWR